jgi:hypothetical protein
MVSINVLPLHPAASNVFLPCCRIQGAQYPEILQHSLVPHFHTVAGPGSISWFPVRVTAQLWVQASGKDLWTA